MEENEKDEEGIRQVGDHEWTTEGWEDVVGEWVETQTVRVVDLRGAEEYMGCRLPYSASFPAPEYAVLAHLLPPRKTQVGIVVPSPMTPEAIEVAARIRQHYPVLFALSMESYRASAASLASLPAPVEGCHPTPSSSVMWTPCPVLATHFGGIADALETGREGSGKKGVVLDLGCGSGRDAVYMAMDERIDVAIGIDNFEAQMPKIRVLAEAAGVGDKVRPVVLDLEDRPMEGVGGGGEDLDRVVGEAMAALSPCEGSLDVVIMARYLYRPLWAWVARALAPGGFVIVHTFTIGCKAFGKPRREKFMLKDGELGAAFPGWEVWDDSVVCIEDGRPLSSFVARKPVVSLV